MPSKEDQKFIAQWSTAAKEAYQQATAKLRLIAQQGRYEASIVLDAVSGRQLDAQIGNMNAVSYEPSKSVESATVIALHVHIDESPNSSDDWDVLLLNPEILCVVAITPTQQHIIQKPLAWNPRSYGLPATQNDIQPAITPGGLFVGYARLLKRRRGIADAIVWEEVPEQTRNAIFAEVNDYLAVRFDIVVRQEKLS